ncbi:MULTISPECIES: hypothetical protein [unclassified Mesorhizobium]|uniref:hypothetical protein n=1 Tax=unclassified Mesorhizobium TaxID=325217 RepID=UPI001FD97488|nr:MULTISPECIES: hypothetical protein [unclassified Mesorhizobium]
MYGGYRRRRHDLCVRQRKRSRTGAGRTGRCHVIRGHSQKIRRERQTPRVSVAIRRTALATRRLGRDELKRFKDWSDGRPETELNFKFYRQATNKIVSLSHGTAAFLDGFF